MRYFFVSIKIAFLYFKKKSKAYFLTNLFLFIFFNANSLLQKIKLLLDNFLCIPEINSI